MLDESDTYSIYKKKHFEKVTARIMFASSKVSPTVESKEIIQISQCKENSSCANL